MVCGHCGGEDISADAWAIWNTQEQAWEVQGGDVFDKGHYCADCDGECRIEAVPIDTPTPERCEECGAREDGDHTEECDVPLRRDDQLFGDPGTHQPLPGAEEDAA